MNKIASIQDFFQFSPKLSASKIAETCFEIRKLLSPFVKTSGMIKSGQHVISPIDSLDAFTQVAAEYNNEIDFMQINFMEGSIRVVFIFQLKNESIGPNGNYTIESGSVALNKQIEQFLRESLSLEKIRNKSPDKIGFIAINPIFKNRQFKLTAQSVFVLMPFKEVWSDVIWEVVRTHLGGLNFQCKRADNLYGHNVIEDIWTGINEADLLIADLTGKNPNVFYEIGIAHTLGKRVVLITQDDEDLPFDFRVYRVVFYKPTPDGLSFLKDQLTRYAKLDPE